MGRRSNLGHYVSNIVATLADSHKDVLDISRDLADVESARNDLWFFQSVCEYIALTAVLIATYLVGRVFVSVGTCIYGMESSDSPVTAAVQLCVLDNFGFIFLMCVLATCAYQFRTVVQRYQDARMGHIERREAQLRHRVMVVVVKMVCKIYDVAIPHNLNADAYIGTVVDVLAHLTAIAGPLVALLMPNWIRFFRFSSSINFLSKQWERIVNYISRARDWVLQRDYRGAMAIGASVSAAALVAGVSWICARKQYTSSWWPTRVVPKRKQRTYTDSPPVRPLDPSELKFVHLNPEPVCKDRTFPEHPTFNGVSVVESSLVRINGQYAATAFRVGNNLITAMHCVGKDEHYPDTGIACYNPDDGKYYWAPLEKYFRNKSPIVGGDGIAICSLPNADFFLTRHSCQLVVPPKTTRFAGSYRLQGATGKPVYSFSIGPCDIEEHLASFKASVEPGSSGGPVINQDGSVLAVTVGHTQFTNYGLLVTRELIDFLVKGGDAQPASSERHTPSPSTTRSMSTVSSEESSTEEDEIPNETGGGPEPMQSKKSQPSKDSIGTTKKGGYYQGRRKKNQKPQGVGPPAPEDHIESRNPNSGKPQQTPGPSPPAPTA